MVCVSFIVYLEVCRCFFLAMITDQKPLISALSKNRIYFLLAAAQPSLNFTIFD